MAKVSYAALMIGGLLLWSLGLLGQESDSAVSQKELRHLATVADSLEHTLPSFECQEQVVSQRILRNKVKKRVEFTAAIRAKRGSDGQLDETFTVSELNGKPVSKRSFGMPIYVSGGFEHALRYFAPDQQACYRYTLSAGRIDFESVAEDDARAECRSSGVKGFALLDADGNVSHIERHVEEDAAEKHGLIPFAAIDFAPVELDKRTFWLSQHVVAEEQHGDWKGRFEANYSACRLFTATVKIGPAEPLDAPDTGGPPPHP